MKFCIWLKSEKVYLNCLCLSLQYYYRAFFCKNCLTFHFHFPWRRLILPIGPTFPLPRAKLSSCTKRLIFLSRSQALCTTVGLGPLPCFCAIIEICKLPNGLRCLGYIFFLNSRGGDMAVKGLFGRQKCVLCHEAYIFSGF